MPTNEYSFFLSCYSNWFELSSVHTCKCCIIGTMGGILHLCTVPWVSNILQRMIVSKDSGCGRDLDAIPHDWPAWMILNVFFTTNDPRKRNT